jgi:flagellar hook-basal body complex protein FliE
MIPPIAGIPAMPGILEMTPVPKAPATDFSRAIGEGLKTLNTDLNASDEVLRGVAAGEAIPLHDVMIVMTQAQLSLQFAVQVRDRLVESYQQLFQMQI